MTPRVPLERGVKVSALATVLTLAKVWSISESFTLPARAELWVFVVATP